MARVLILSSWVAFGHVGLCAAGPALHALGSSVTQLPTVMLSNHPGWPNVAGRPVPVTEIQSMIEAFEANGWLAQQEALLVGYLPSADHVDLACDLIMRLRRTAPELRVVVDPVLGDDPKGLYLPETVAQTLRDRLVPLAGVLTPNRFELEWLTGKTVDSNATAQQVALGLIGQSGAHALLLTSPPLKRGHTGVLQVSPKAVTLWQTPLRDGVPHGVGDVFSGLIAAGLPPAQALGHLDALIRASLKSPHLRIAETASVWTEAAPVAPSEI